MRAGAIPLKTGGEAHALEDTAVEMMKKAARLEKEKEDEEKQRREEERKKTEEEHMRKQMEAKAKALVATRHERMKTKLKMSRMALAQQKAAKTALIRRNNMDSNSPEFGFALQFINACLQQWVEHEGAGTTKSAMATYLVTALEEFEERHRDHHADARAFTEVFLGALSGVVATSLSRLAIIDTIKEYGVLSHMFRFMLHGGNVKPIVIPTMGTTVNLTRNCVSGVVINMNPPAGSDAIIKVGAHTLVNQMNVCLPASASEDSITGVEAVDGEPPIITGSGMIECVPSFTMLVELTRAHAAVVPRDLTVLGAMTEVVAAVCDAAPGEYDGYAAQYVVQEGGSSVKSFLFVASPVRGDANVRKALGRCIGQAKADGDNTVLAQLYQKQWTLCDDERLMSAPLPSTKHGGTRTQALPLPMSAFAKTEQYKDANAAALSKIKAFATAIAAESGFIPHMVTKSGRCVINRGNTFHVHGDGDRGTIRTKGTPGVSFLSACSLPPVSNGDVSDGTHIIYAGWDRPLIVLQAVPGRRVAVLGKDPPVALPLYVGTTITQDGDATRWLDEQAKSDKVLNHHRSSGAACLSDAIDADSGVFLCPASPKEDELVTFIASKAGLAIDATSESHFQPRGTMVVV